MPDRPWFRQLTKRLREVTEAEKAQWVAFPAQRTDTSAARAGYLRRAADCYVRAGELTAAAGCLGQLSSPLELDEAARLYLRAGEYQLAAQTYARAGRTEVAGWTLVHYLDDAASARAILKWAPPQDVSPLLPRMDTSPWSDMSADSPVGTRVRRLTDRLASLPASGTGGIPGQPWPPRARMAQLLNRILGGALDDSEVPTILAEIREITADMVSARDVAAAYLARELRRLISELQDHHDEQVQRSQQQAREQRTIGLARRQVYARCDVADGFADNRVLEVLALTQQALAGNSATQQAERTEAWGIAIAEAIRRYDQVALIFAAAVRGHRTGAARRWQEWSTRVLHAAAVIPAELELA